MKPSETLREAARRIERGRDEFSCIAIKNIDGNRYSVFSPDFARLPAALAYAELLGRMPAAYDFEPETTQEGRDERVVALCLAAAIAESEGQ